MENKKTNKKAQGWGMDLIIGVTIFTFGLVAFYIYSLNSPGEDNLENLFYEGKILANTILSEGSPENWNEDPGTVTKIGVLSNNKINQAKLESFYDLTSTEEGYENTKKLFDITYDYYFYLNDEMDINEDGSLMIDGIGKPDFDKDNPVSSDIKNLVKITRYVIYKNKPMTAYFYIWEE